MRGDLYFGQQKAPLALICREPSACKMLIFLSHLLATAGSYNPPRMVVWRNKNVNNVLTNIIPVISIIYHFISVRNKKNSHKNNQYEIREDTELSFFPMFKFLLLVVLV